MIFCFLNNRGSLDMIHLDSYLFYDICNTVNEHIYCVFNVFNLVSHLERRDWKIFSIILSHLLLIMISMWSLFQCMTSSLSLSLEEIKLIPIVNWIFLVSVFFKLFMMYFKYGLISSRYFLIWLIGFYVYHNYFHIQYNYCSKNYLLLLVCNNLLTH